MICLLSFFPWSFRSCECCFQNFCEISSSCEFNWANWISIQLQEVLNAHNSRILLIPIQRKAMSNFFRSLRRPSAKSPSWEKFILIILLYNTTYSHNSSFIFIQWILIYIMQTTLFPHFSVWLRKIYSYFEIQLTLSF